ncbi:hypothetical protein MPSEU_000776400 [Mayamaea pseudoterrestris]|nr:hypothetical protein MPSEU_000776400 [Mayamaea pseudoterrestris]
MRPSRLRALHILLPASLRSLASSAFSRHIGTASWRRLGSMSASSHFEQQQPKTIEDDNSVHIISPLAAASANENGSSTLIILNSPIACPPSPLFDYLWNSSQVRICADGGANRLHNANPKYLPNLIVGDLDSLNDSVRAYYLHQDVNIEQDFDQDCNDLDKALQRCSQKSRVVIYGAFGGRFDQEMASMQALYKWDSHFPKGLWLYNDETCACLVGGRRAVEDASSQRKYVVTMKLPNDEMDESRFPCEGPTCGLIPLATPCRRVTTDGFKWNLANQRSEFGRDGIVSTSNHMMGKAVTIESSDPLVFTAEVHSGNT